MKKKNWTVVFFSSWLLFVVSLAAWWMIFSLRLIHTLSEQNPTMNFNPQKWMLVGEGAVLILCLFLGGGTLIFYSLREQKRFSEIQLFFSTFNHDIKTSIARLLLQSERLQKKESDEIDFQKSLTTLEMQLENSLYLAQEKQRSLVFESIDLKDILQRVHSLWPELQIHFQGKKSFLADSAALESVFKNLFSNSFIHGQASEIFVSLVEKDPWVVVEYSDNSSQKLQQDPKNWGKELKPSKKGSGLGLYIVRQWMERMNAHIHFIQMPEGRLRVELHFRKAKESL